MDVHQKKHAAIPMPRIWLMTDPRLDAELMTAVQRLRFGSGIILRHYHLESAKRRALFRALYRLSRRRGHKLFLAGDERTAIRWGADGFHNRSSRARSRNFPQSAPVHNPLEIAIARHIGADMLFLSPVFATQSHSGGRSLGLFAFNRFATLAYPRTVIALGGMTECKASMIGKKRIYGWAGIDAFRKEQAKR
jgi:thiamine-phosphate pyrophosphorylase